MLHFFMKATPAIMKKKLRYSSICISWDKDVISQYVYSQYNGNFMWSPDALALRIQLCYIAWPDHLAKYLPAGQLHMQGSPL